MAEKRHEEYQYLDLLQNILDNGIEKDDRTGVGTKSIFGAQMRFSLRDQFPILTTKRVYWKGVIEELLWFIRGDTDSKKLENIGVNIWKGNTSADFLSKHNPPLRYPEGYIGPGYGFQWRNWNGTYESKASSEYVQKDYPDGGYAFVPTNEKFIVHTEKNGIDQLDNVIKKIKINPNDRRLIVSSWNPEQIDDMALPPCHCLFQFYVANGELSCHLYQRSVDTFLGLGFNISSYSLLTYIVADLVSLKPGDFVWSGGDIHLYSTHIDQAKIQLKREPYPFPKVVQKKKCQSLKEVEQLDFKDFELVDYQCHPAISASMAI